MEAQTTNGSIRDSNKIGDAFYDNQEMTSNRPSLDVSDATKEKDKTELAERGGIGCDTVGNGQGLDGSGKVEEGVEVGGGGDEEACARLVGDIRSREQYDMTKTVECMIQDNILTGENSNNSLNVCDEKIEVDVPVELSDIEGITSEDELISLMNFEAPPCLEPTAMQIGELQYKLPNNKGMTLHEADGSCSQSAQDIPRSKYDDHSDTGSNILLKFQRGYDEVPTATFSAQEQTQNTDVIENVIETGELRKIGYFDTLQVQHLMTRRQGFEQSERHDQMPNTGAFNNLERLVVKSLTTESHAKSISSQTLPQSGRGQVSLANSSTVINTRNSGRDDATHGVIYRTESPIPIEPYPCKEKEGNRYSAASITVDDDYPNIFRQMTAYGSLAVSQYKPMLQSGLTSLGQRVKLAIQHTATTL